MSHVLYTIIPGIQLAAMYVSDLFGIYVTGLIFWEKLLG